MLVWVGPNTWTRSPGIIATETCEGKGAHLRVYWRRLDEPSGRQARLIGSVLQVVRQDTTSPSGIRLKNIRL
jgi:hypothetical protein